MQEFIHLGNLSDALARSRSLGVAWVLAHQLRDQLPADTKNAVDAYALNKIVFRLGVKDAKEIATMTPALTTADFMALQPYGVYASLMRNGRDLGWVSGQTKSPPPAISDPIEILAASQKLYGVDPVRAWSSMCRPKMRQPHRMNRSDGARGRNHDS